MAKKVELKERGTNETVYPVTSVNCIIKDDGSNISGDISKLNYIGGGVEIGKSAAI